MNSYCCSCPAVRVPQYQAPTKTHAAKHINYRTKYKAHWYGMMFFLQTLRVYNRFLSSIKSKSRETPVALSILIELCLHRYTCGCRLDVHGGRIAHLQNAAPPIAPLDLVKHAVQRLPTRVAFPVPPSSSGLGFHRKARKWTASARRIGGGAAVLFSCLAHDRRLRGRSSRPRCGRRKKCHGRMSGHPRNGKRRH